MKPHRIAAGGIIIRGDAILLVRYPLAGGGSFLVAPGGALEPNENAVEAVVRETLEETGVAVQPRKILWIEDLQCERFKMCKIWMLCDFVEGQVRNTEGAREEGIIEVGWYRKEQLVDEVVFPSPVGEREWLEFTSDSWEAECLESRRASF